ncbi:MAG: hypothetical protein ILO42_03185 [Clostridia bacterium]|nr:hypothetical protein [Clostridia bacterium]
MYPFASEETDRLFDAVLGLKTREECYAFFDDLCTIKEIRDMSLRFEGAIMLEKGDNYNQISEKIGLSPATISRISRCLNYGSGGYRAAIERIAKENEDK